MRLWLSRPGQTGQRPALHPTLHTLPLHSQGRNKYQMGTDQPHLAELAKPIVQLEIYEYSVGLRVQYHHGKQVLRLAHSHLQCFPGILDMSCLPWAVLRASHSGKCHGNGDYSQSWPHVSHWHQSEQGKSRIHPDLYLQSYLKHSVA